MVHNKFQWMCRVCVGNDFSLVKTTAFSQYVLETNRSHVDGFGVSFIPTIPCRWHSWIWRTCRPGGITLVDPNWLTCAETIGDPIANPTHPEALGADTAHSWWSAGTTKVNLICGNCISMAIELFWISIQKFIKQQWYWLYQVARNHRGMFSESLLDTFWWFCSCSFYRW